MGTISLLFVCLVVWVIRTTPEPPPDQPVIDTEKKMVYDGNTLSEERNGKRIWDLTAKRMETDLKSNNTELTDLVGHFYREDGKSIELKAKHGIYQQDKQEIHIDGDVLEFEVRSKKGSLARGTLSLSSNETRRMISDSYRNSS